MTVVNDRPRGQRGETLPRVRAISRAVAILRAFSAHRPQMALREIVEATELDAGTTRRILVTLRDEGLVHQDAASGLYSASTGLLDLARAVPETLTLTALVEQRMIRLAEDTQTTVYLSVDDADAARCTLRRNGGQAIEVRWWAVGERRAYNRGTAPRVLLAHREPQDRTRLVRELTGPAEAPALFADIETIRSEGCIVKHDEIAIGISAMAVPLLSETGELLAAVSTGGLSPRYHGEAATEMRAAMQDAVADMQRMVRGVEHFNK